MDTRMASSLNLHLLRMFEAVARLGSFSEAATALHVSQPAVSRAVRELEEQVGLPLIERGSDLHRSAIRGVRLTPDGQALQAHAQGIFALEHAAVQDLRQRVGLQSGTLVVAASTTVAGYWLPGYLALWRQHYPRLHCALRVGNTEEVAGWVARCEADVGLVEGGVTGTRMRWRWWPPPITLWRGLEPSRHGSCSHAGGSLARPDRARARRWRPSGLPWALPPPPATNWAATRPLPVWRRQAMVWRCCLRCWWRICCSCRPCRCWPLPQPCSAEPRPCSGSRDRPEPAGCAHCMC